MPAAVSIRFVTRKDYAEWLPLWEGYNRLLRSGRRCGRLCRICATAE
jgi:hypothetical protein